ncbi:MAG: NADH-quinone oxidoreductase subunit J [Betaproteobacteria bacterium]
MDIKTILFLIFAAIMLGAATRVVTARNPVHAVLFLVLAFFSAACLWILLKAEFLAIALVLVYVGAVMVLFLFVVMMLDVHIDRGEGSFWRHAPVALGVAALILLQLWLVLAQPAWLAMTSAPPPPPAQPPSNIHALGLLTFTDYIYPLQVAGALLLVAIVAAIALTLRGRKDSRHQDPSLQVRVAARDRVRLVSMEADEEGRQTRKV